MTEPQEPRSTAPNHLTTDELSECAFSPETAAAGWLEHAEGCAECSAELADLRLVLAELAELPEPELPESVGIRLDAAVARAWLDADADAEREAASRASAAAESGQRRRRSWRRLAVPLGSLALIVGVIAGVGTLVHNNSSSSSSSGTAGVSAGSAPFGTAAGANSGLTAWVQSVLPVNPADSTSTGTVSGQQQPKSSSMAHTQSVRCPTTPPRAGYTVLTTSEREFEGVPATLVVYQNAEEPASNTVYAVVYAGSCPSSESSILTQGAVNR